MREFYVYGFKSREDYDKKSSRSYDDERRRMESWLGEHMSFVRTAEGKNVFISVDSRTSRHNPFYKAWKAKSFTDGDITLHFILFDILHSPEVSLPLADIMLLIDEKYLAGFESPMMFDESTVRKKLKEYTENGIIVAEKQGRKVFYRRAESLDIAGLYDVLDYYSEVAPCGVVGSFLLDKLEGGEDIFTFKHHYMTGAMDSGVLAELFDAMRKKCAVTVSNLSRSKDEPRRNKIVPLRVFISVQSGRQHLLAYRPDFGCIGSFRIDYLSGVKTEEPVPNFDELRARLDAMQEKMWGVNTWRGRKASRPEHIEFTVQTNEGEEHIVRRLMREKRIGKVEKLGENVYRFCADVYDAEELTPWIRTFICRITDMKCSNRTVERRFKSDIEEMYRLYGIGEGEEA
ncbi:MAG: WYL domain-containing transcriptional regulator [Clostridia bacterium]|nr:WYL domain-containing transcriptional regulator [Clostridia bacterium]